MEKTIAWFLGLYSFIPSHIVASTRVGFLETNVDEETSSFCESAREERKGTIQSSTTRNIDNLIVQTLTNNHLQQANLNITRQESLPDTMSTACSEQKSQPPLQEPLPVGLGPDVMSHHLQGIGYHDEGTGIDPADHPLEPG